MSDKILEKQLSYIQKLNDKILESLKLYTTEYYVKLNTAMRNKTAMRNNMKQHENVIINIKKAFCDAPPLETALTVYRGLDVSSKDKINLEDESFMSTSLSKKQALSFAGSYCCLLQITVPARTKVLPLYKISDSSPEMEILLDKGKLTVNDINDGVGAATIVYATYTGNSVELSNKQDMQKELEYMKNYEKMIVNIMDMINIKLKENKDNDPDDSDDDQLDIKQYAIQVIKKIYVSTFHTQITEEKMKSVYQKIKDVLQ
jgi:hypothetical protein